MPAGCDFICANENCSQHNNGFVITAPWPMGKISLVINSSRVKNIPEFREKLIKEKNSGRKYACITYPNTDDIPIERYRVQYWSHNAQCIWQYEVIKNDNETIQEAIQRTETIPFKCPKTNGPLMTFQEVLSEGIECAFCGEKLKQSRWFTQEK